MLLPTSLDALLNPSAMKLSMGEMSHEELVAAQQAVRDVMEGLAESGWSAGDREPPQALLQSMAVRLDHGLGLPGYYDQFSPPGTHQRMLEHAMDVAKAAHASFVRHAPAFPAALIDALQGKHARTDLSPSDPVRLSAFAAVRYALTNAGRHGLVLLPQALSSEMATQAMADVERCVTPESSGSLSPEELRASLAADVRRFYEETVGTGFYNPAWTLEGLSRPRGPRP